MTLHPIITAGQALATFASEIAHDAIQASGDAADGEYALTLMNNWARAVCSVQLEGIEYTLGKAAGKQEGTALRDEVLDLATIVLDGFTAALELTGDPDDCGGAERSMPEIEASIAAALASSNRLHAVILECGGQTQLQIPRNDP